MRAGGLLPSTIATILAVCAGHRWVELGEEFFEDVGKLRIVVLRLRADNLDCLAVAVCSWLLLAACLVHHAESIPAVVDVRKAIEEIASGGLGLFQLSGLDEADGGIGGGGQLF